MVSNGAPDQAGSSDTAVPRKIRRARIYDLVPVRELPYGPAAPSLHQRPDRWQHPTTCRSSSKTACISRGVHRWVHGLVHHLRPEGFCNDSSRLEARILSYLPTANSNSDCACFFASPKAACLGARSLKHRLNTSSDFSSKSVRTASQAGIRTLGSIEL